jgi:hypothetical protein
MSARVSPLQAGYGLLIVVFLAFNLWLQTFIALADDNIFYLFAAERLLGGGQFYSHIYDINPPLIVLLSVPPALLSHLLPISLASAFIVWVYVLILIALLLIARLAPLRLDDNPHVSAIAFTLLAVLLATLASGEIGQREHLVSIFCAPWVCLVARRWSGEAVSRTAAIACASYAALGFGLKPYFLLFPAMVLAVDVWRERSLRRVVSAENLTFLFWGAVYWLAIVAFFPGWLKIAASGVHTYGEYKNPMNLVMREAYFLVVPAGFCLGLGFLFASGRQLRATFQALGLALIASAFSALIQVKEWNYHFIPVQLVFGLLCVLVTLVAIDRWRNGGWRGAGTALLVVSCAAIILKFLFISYYSEFHWGTIASLRQSELYRVLHERMRGERVMSASSAGGPSGALLYAGAKPGTRFLMFLDLPYVLKNLPNISKLAPDVAARVEGLDKFLKAAAVEDLQRDRPKFILFEITPNMQAVPPDFDIQRYLSASDAFVAEMRNYELFRDPRIANGVVHYSDRSFRVYQRL